jgi:two-component system, cell cycle response regulator DivK
MNHVLIVEDDPINAAVMRTVLVKRGGFEVSVSESADEILAAVRGGGVALVLMDVSLSNTRWEGRPIGGVELCRMIKADPAIAHVPVMLATAHAMRGDADKLKLESGADDYVAKPIVDHDAFVKQVRRWIERAA